MLCVAAQFHVNAPSSCPLSALLQGNRCVWQANQAPAACAFTHVVSVCCARHVSHLQPYTAKWPMGEVRSSAPGTLPVCPSAAAEQGMQPSCCLSPSPTPGLRQCARGHHTVVRAPWPHRRTMPPLHPAACMCSGRVWQGPSRCCPTLDAAVVRLGCLWPLWLCAVVGPQLPTQQTVGQGQGSGGGGCP
jgi:hypothetical protein